jgi:hypothetical protein
VERRCLEKESNAMRIRGRSYQAKHEALPHKSRGQIASNQPSAARKEDAVARLLEAVEVLLLAQEARLATVAERRALRRAVAAIKRLHQPGGR